MPRTDHHVRAGCWEPQRRFGCRKWHGNWTFCEFNFLLAIFFKRRTYRYKWNEWENIKISRVQATKSSSEAEKDEQDLPVRKKSNASEGFNSALKRENVGVKSSRAEETNQEAQKRLKAQRQWGTRRQCQRAEQTARRLLDQSEGNACRHENDKTTITTQPATKVLTQPATSSSEKFYAIFVNSRFSFRK